jgi:Tfp pilus assembly protein PilF
MKLRTLQWITSICILVGANPIASSQQSWSMVGSVQTYHGELPDRPILVTLQFRGNTIGTTFSDSEGKFSFSELSPNMYNVVVDDDKYNRVEQRVEINPLITSPSFVRISLVPKERTATRDLSPGSNPNTVSPLQLKDPPNAALKEYKKGQKAEEDGRVDDAIDHYRKAIKVAPDFFAAKNSLGSAYMGKSQFGDAQQQFEDVIKSNPTDATAYFNLGNLFLLTKRYEDSLQKLDAGMRLRPESAFGHFLMGALNGHVGKPVQAETELRRALELDPKMSQAYLQLVNLHLQQGRKPDAIVDLEAYLKQFPRTPFSDKAKELLRRLKSEVGKSKKE